MEANKNDLHESGRPLTKEEFIGALQDDFMITYSPEPVKPTVLHEIGMYLDGNAAAGSTGGAGGNAGNNGGLGGGGGGGWRRSGWPPPPW